MANRASRKISKVVLYTMKKKLCVGARSDLRVPLRQRGGYSGASI